MREKRLVVKMPLPILGNAVTPVSPAQDKLTSKSAGARSSSHPPWDDYNEGHRIVGLLEQLLRTKCRFGLLEEKVNAALTYLHTSTTPAERECLGVFLAFGTPRNDVWGKIRESLNAWPKEGFRGSVNTVQAAPDKALRQNPAGTTEPQMLRSRTLRAAKREVVRRQERQTKPRPARVNHQRIGKTSMTLWVDPKLLARIDHIAEKQDLTRQDFLAHMLEYVATQYEHGPKGSTKVFDEAAAELRRLEKTVRRVAGTLAVSTLAHK